MLFQNTTDKRANTLIFDFTFFNSLSTVTSDEFRSENMNLLSLNLSKVKKIFTRRNLRHNIPPKICPAIIQISQKKKRQIHGARTFRSWTLRSQLVHLGPRTLRSWTLLIAQYSDPHCTRCVRNLQCTGHNINIISSPENRKYYMDL